jgi:hypothetical protein
MRTPRPSLQDHSIESLRVRFAETGIEPWRAEQVAGWLYGRGIDDGLQINRRHHELSKVSDANSSSISGLGKFS